MTISKIAIRYSLFIQGRAVRVGRGEILWNQNIGGWRLWDCGEVGEGGEGVVVEQGENIQTRREYQWQMTANTWQGRRARPGKN